MDADLARILATAAMRASKDLGELIPFLARHLPDDVELRRGIADVIAEIGQNILNPAFAACPELENEFDQRVQKYGRTT